MNDNIFFSPSFYFFLFLLCVSVLFTIRLLLLVTTTVLCSNARSRERDFYLFRASCQLDFLPHSRKSTGSSSSQPRKNTRARSVSRVFLTGDKKKKEEETGQLIFNQRRRRRGCRQNGHIPYSESTRPTSMEKRDDGKIGSCCCPRPSGSRRRRRQQKTAFRQPSWSISRAFH